jgi:hypothetical protein
MSSSSTRDNLRRWVEDQRAGEERERQEAREKGLASNSIAAAFDLIDLAARLHGWPIPEDPVRRRDVELARDRWDRVRAALRGSPTEL